VRSAGELLRDPAVDVAIVEGFSDEMPALTIQAIEHGKAVLVDKPGANNLEALRRVAEVAARHPRVPVQVGYMIRFAAIMERVEEVVREGYLGRILSARFHAAIPGHDALMDWFSLPWDLGGALLEDGCHMLDLALHLLGRPRRVAGFVPKYDDLRERGHRWEDAAAVALEFDRYVASYDLVGWEANDWIETWEIAIFGTEGTLVAGLLPAFCKIYLNTPKGPYQSGWTLYEPTHFTQPWSSRGAAGAHVEHLVTNLAVYDRELRSFLRVVRGEQAAPEVPLSEALAVMEVIDAIYRSAREGRVVEV